MVDEKLRSAVMADIVMLKIMGVNPVIVHGGGAAITENMDRWGLDVEFKNGQRVTTDEAMDVVKMTLIGKVNEELVLAMNAHGNLAVGVNGTDAGTIVAEKKSAELGRVGTVTEVDPSYINALIAADYVPIIASVEKATTMALSTLMLMRLLLQLLLLLAHTRLSFLPMSMVSMLTS